MMMLAVFLGIVFCVGGLFISDACDLPSGATIVLLAGAGFCSSFVGKKVWTRIVIFRTKVTGSSEKIDTS